MSSLPIKHYDIVCKLLFQKNSYEETLKSIQEHISKTNESYQEKVFMIVSHLVIPCLFFEEVGAPIPLAGKK